MFKVWSLLRWGSSIKILADLFFFFAAFRTDFFFEMAAPWIAANERMVFMRMQVNADCNATELGHLLIVFTISSLNDLVFS